MAFMVMNLKNKYTTAFLLALVAMAAYSCRKAESDDSHYRDRINLNFITASTPQTRQTASEAQIKDIYALVFVSNGTQYVYQYSIRAMTINPIGNFTTQFNLTLFTQTQAAKIYIVANANTDVVDANLEAGEFEDSVRLKIIDEFPSEGIGNYFPMWGEYEFPSGISQALNNTSINMPLLRAVARVDISTESVPLTQFVMESVEVFRASSLFQVAPNSYTSPPMTVSAPSIPETSFGGTDTYPIATTSPSTSIAQLYLPEVAAPLPADLTALGCCVIVGGRYNSSAEITYYRLDFTPDGYPAGQILRNHQYSFNITAVTAPGAPTPDDAASENAAGIIADFTDWTDVFIDAGMWGPAFFNISSRNVIMGSTAGVTTIPVQTSIAVADFRFAWSDSSGRELSQLSSFLQNDNLYVTMTPSGLFVNMLTDNPTGSGRPRISYILIAAGRDRILVNITQLDT